MQVASCLIVVIPVTCISQDSSEVQQVRRRFLDDTESRPTSSMKVSDEDSGKKSAGCHIVVVSFRMGSTCVSMYGAMELTSSSCSLLIVCRICNQAHPALQLRESMLASKPKAQQRAKHLCCCYRQDY